MTEIKCRTFIARNTHETGDVLGTILQWQMPTQDVQILNVELIERLFSWPGKYFFSNIWKGRVWPFFFSVFPFFSSLTSIAKKNGCAFQTDIGKIYLTDDRSCDFFVFLD